MKKSLRTELINEKIKIEKEIDELIRQIWVKKQIVKILDEKLKELPKPKKDENIEPLPYIKKK